MGEIAEEITRELEEFAIVVDENALSKMKDLCLTYGFSPEDIVSSWIAFSATKNCNNEPALDTLEQFEREELMKSTKLTKNRKSQVKNHSLSAVYDSHSVDSLTDTHEAPEQHTPDFKKGVTAKSPKLFSPSSFTPIRSTPSAKYSTRKASGEVVCKLGASDDSAWETRMHTTCSAGPFDAANALQSSYTYMFEKLRDYASVLNDMIEDMTSQFQNITEWAPIHLPAMEPVPVIGRICCEGSGKLNAQSILLEGSQETSSCQVLPLDVSQLEKFSFFPGQIIAGEGINSLGKKLTLKSLFKPSSLPFSEETPNFEINEVALSLVVSAGPYTTSDSLSYEPLADLMKYVKAHQPHVCILCGPFVDIKHEEIEGGNLPETYEEMFSHLLSVITSNLDEICTKVFLVPSMRDAHHDAIYPTPPFETKQKYKNIYFTSDPCLLNINGVVIGITSTDILLHLGKEEINFPMQSSDRLGRLCEHLLTQRNFYPLYPPADDVNIDYVHFESHCLLPVMPHILVLPSDLKGFIKDINGCCCINPQRLTKGSVGGSFARIKIKPFEPSEYSGSLTQHMQVETIKI